MNGFMRARYRGV